jgi:hypothetical protein
MGFHFRGFVSVFLMLAFVSLAPLNLCTSRGGPDGQAGGANDSVG